MDDKLHFFVGMKRCKVRNALSVPNLSLAKKQFGLWAFCAYFSRFNKAAMRLILFLSRVALICNLFFVLTVILHFYQYATDSVLVSTIVIIGYALAVFVFTPIVNLSYLALLLFRRPMFRALPKWLVLLNFLFLILQIIYIILFLNESFFN